MYFKQIFVKYISCIIILNKREIEQNKMKNIDFELGRLAGILDTFALLNTKTNHDYSFKIISLQVCEQSQIAFQNYFLEIYPEASIIFEELSIADLKLRDVLREWLFSYQKSDDINEKLIGSGSGLCYLYDKYRDFYLTDIDVQTDYVQTIFEKIKRLIKVQKIYQVYVHTNSWYECSWDDFIFEGEDGSIFLHLGVSD